MRTAASLQRQSVLRPCLPACLSDTRFACPLQELAMLRLLSKHLTPTAPAAPATNAPRPHQQFQRLNGSHKTIYLGGTCCKQTLCSALC